MNWAQRLKRVFSIDVETFNKCGAAVSTPVRERYCDWKTSKVKPGICPLRAFRPEQRRRSYQWFIS